MTHANRAIDAGGISLVIASSLMIAVLALHGPIAPDLTEQMSGIAGRAFLWKLLHWTAAAALALFAVAGWSVATAGSRLTESTSTHLAWGIVPLGALATMVTAVAEATVVADAAATGSLETYAAWWAFSEGMANGFVVMAMAVAVIARGEARSSRPVVPTWAAWTGAIGGGASAFGWALGMWFGIRLGNLLWIVASITMSMWLLWFGLGLIRSRKVREEVSARREVIR